MNRARIFSASLAALAITTICPGVVTAVPTPPPCSNYKSTAERSLPYEICTKNSAIGRIQKALGLPKTGKFDAKTFDKIVSFQASRSLQQTGKIDLATLDEIADFVGDTDEIGSSDVSGWVKQLEQSLGRFAPVKEGEVDESALQAYLGNKKYGKDGMRKLQQLGREHASKATVAKAKAEYTSEDLDADQKRVGQLGPTEKVKNNNIGKLVGANENFINTVDQAVVSEMDKSQTPPGRDDDVKGPEGKATPITPKKMADDAKKVLDKQKVKEGQSDLDRILIIMNHRR